MAEGDTTPVSLCAAVETWCLNQAYGHAAVEEEGMMPVSLCAAVERWCLNQVYGHAAVE